MDELFDIARGGSPRPIDSHLTDDPGGMPWIMIGDTKPGSKYIEETRKRIKQASVSRSRVIEPGAFLLTNSMSFGRPYISKIRGCIHDGWLVLERKSAEIDDNYFFHALSSPATFQQFEKLAAGATVKNLNKELVARVLVPLPPLAEQRRVAALLDKAEELRAKRRAALALLDKLPQAIFLEIFGDPIANPMGWRRSTLKCLGRVVTGRTPPGAVAGMYGGEIPFVTPGDLESAGAKRMLTEAGAASVNIVSKGSALVCCIGATIGKMDIARTDCAFNQQINAVQWGDEINGNYGIQCLKFFKGKIATDGASTTLPILKKSLFEQIGIPVPPIDLQLQFAVRVEAIHGAKSDSQAALAESENLFTSLQQRVFGATTSEEP